MEKICVIGLGYVGLPTASLFATNGFKVIGVDINEAVVEAINKGRVDTEEKGLKTHVQAAINSGNLKAQKRPEKADVFIVAVPTPLKKNKTADLSHVKKAIRSITPHIRKGNLIIIESTLPPGTTKHLITGILEKYGLNVKEDIYLAHCPERVLPGRLIRELIENDRIIGGINRASAERAEILYKKFVNGRIYLTDATTAEMTKLAENTYRDVNIALVNELTPICEEIGINIWDVIELANKHPRVRLHYPGPGVGGHCIPVDPWFIADSYPRRAKLVKLARRTNDSMPEYIVKKIRKILKGKENPKVAILGVSYKGNVDDTRNSPSIDIIEMLRGECRISIHDPHIRDFKYGLSGIEETFKDADLIVIVTDHDEFSRLEPERVGRMMRTRIILDTRNCIDGKRWKEAGFRIYLPGCGNQG